MYHISVICEAIGGRFLQKADDTVIAHLVFDSRRLQQPSDSLFFALKTGHNDGHKYITDAYKKGIRNFVISGELPGRLNDANIIFVDDSLKALQQLASFHRDHFTFPTIGITGSNGKTVVKEWLHQLLHEEHQVVRSPKSFNSQIGVALSVWQMNAQHTIGLFEAGISRPGEMMQLQQMIRPTIGVLTNIGDAHNEGFIDKSQKLQEKLILFKDCPLLIARNKDLGGKKELAGKDTQVLTWGSAANNDFVVNLVSKQQDRTELIIGYGASELHVSIPFSDEASVENAITCCCVMLVLGYETEKIAARIALLHAIDMRLQLRHSFNDCLVINDSYSADITSLKIALDFLQQQGSGLSRTVILSEFFESGSNDEELYRSIGALLKTYRVSKVVAIGEKIAEVITGELPPETSLQTYASTNDFIISFRSSQFYREIILIKGARKFEFERIARLFEKKLHQTVLEINLNALVHNLKEYQKMLKPGCKVMAMVKAFSYGSGGAEIASVLQYHNTDFLGVAYADEGVELVKAGISLPVMVMNAEESSFQSITEYNLQPVMYSFELLHKFETYLDQQGLASYPVHIEIETGMNRLGFAQADWNKLVMHLKNQRFSIQSVFSHLAASEDPTQDEFTGLQAQLFEQAAGIIAKGVGANFLRHISNSAAIVRHPQLQMDMVRLGIGLYGVEVDNDDLLQLQAVATLRSTVAQLKPVKKGESVSYNRRGVVNRDSLVATVRIGYADGYSRQFSNGVGKMWIRGTLAPVIGTVCMDMTMIDVTDVPGVEEGDEIIIFGPELPVQQVASWIKTIPYEIMTGVSQRVKRIYFHE